MKFFNLCKCKCKKNKKYFMLEKDEYVKLDSDEECGICLDPLIYSPCIKTEKCNHIFHIHCYKNMSKQQRLENI